MGYKSLEYKVKVGDEYFRFIEVLTEADKTSYENIEDGIIEVIESKKFIRYSYNTRISSGFILGRKKNFAPLSNADIDYFIDGEKSIKRVVSFNNWSFSAGLKLKL